MLNLSSPPTVTSCYPLPSKVQLSLLGRDCQVAITRLKALNISVSPTLPIAVTTSPGRYSFFPPHINIKSKNYSNISDVRHTVPELNYVRAPSVRRVSKVYSFLPLKYIDYGPHRLIDGFHVGKFSAYCPLSKTFDSYVCQDHGQYPWGHCHDKGVMAILCRKLGIL